MKKSLVVYSYDQVAALRLFITFIVLLPFVFRGLKKIQRKHIYPLLIASLFGSGIHCNPINACLKYNPLLKELITNL